MVVSNLQTEEQVTSLMLDPVRDSDYHTVFNFKEGAAERLPNLVIGSQILVEGRSLILRANADVPANIGTRTSEVEGRKTYSTTLT